MAAEGSSLASQRVSEERGNSETLEKGSVRLQGWMAARLGVDSSLWLLVGAQAGPEGQAPRTAPN